MKRVVDALMMCLFVTAGVVAACEDDYCPPLQNVERGEFKLYDCTFSALTEGTMEIRENDVEIVYKDKNNVEWRVLYDIVSERKVTDL